jgi:hypothetical protein
VAYRAYDAEPDSIVKRMSRRDQFPGDWMEINIDFTLIFARHFPLPFLPPELGEMSLFLIVETIGMTAGILSGRPKLTLMKKDGPPK